MTGALLGGSSVFAKAALSGDEPSPLIAYCPSCGFGEIVTSYTTTPWIDTGTKVDCSRLGSSYNDSVQEAYRTKTVKCSYCYRGYTDPPVKVTREFCPH